MLTAADIDGSTWEPHRRVGRGPHCCPLLARRVEPLKFDRGDVPDRFEQASTVEAVDSFQRGAPTLSVRSNADDCPFAVSRSGYTALQL